MTSIQGGYHGSIGPLSSTEIYNSETNTVVNGPGMLYDAYSLCATRNKLTGQIYFVGGFGWENNNGNKFRTGTLVFDTVTRAFSILSGQLTVGRAGATCAVLENDELLIAAGGISDGWQGTSTVEILDLKTKTWSNAGVMPYTAGVWTAGEFLFLLGTELYQYELNSNQWLELVDVPFDFSKMRHHFVQVDASLGNFCPFA